MQENDRAALLLQDIFAVDENIPGISRSIQLNQSAVQGSNSKHKVGVHKDNRSKKGKVFSVFR